MVEKFNKIQFCYFNSTFNGQLNIKKTKNKITSNYLLNQKFLDYI
jgi:hypothetical protein